jgi:hypothetical protein
MDFILISTIINLVWSVFGFIFFLYKFTSLLSYIYGFTKFCSKLLYGLKWVKNKIFPSLSDSDSEESDVKIPFIQRCKNFFSKKSEYTTIPLYESTHNSIPNTIHFYSNSDSPFHSNSDSPFHSNSDSPFHSNSDSPFHSIPTTIPFHSNSSRDYFTQHFNELMRDEENNPYNDNENEQSIYLNYAKTPLLNEFD